MQEIQALDTHNPIFEYDLRKLGLDQAHYQRTDRLIIIVSVVASVIIANVLWAANPGGSGSFPVLALTVMTMLSVLAEVFPFAASLYYMFTTITSINTEIIGNRWDEIRLTNVSEDELLAAKYAILQLRMHRMLSIARAMQLVAVIFSLVVPWYMKGYPSPARGGETITSNLLIYLANMCIVLALAYYRPLWSMKAIIAASLACAVRVRQLPFAVLAGLCTLVAMYIVLQIIQIMLRITIVTLFPISTVILLDILIYSTVASAIYVVVFYWYYRFARTIALRLAVQNAFPEE